MMKAKTPFIVGLFMLAGILAFVFTFGSLNKGIDASEAYTVYAQFEDVSGLAPGSRILIAGIEVGRLGTPLLDPDAPDKALVPMLIRDNIDLYEGVFDENKGTWIGGASAMRRQASLIGDFDVTLSPGLQGKKLVEGDRIPNVINESGLEAVLKTLQDSSESILPQLETITGDIQAITSSLRSVIGDKEGTMALETMRNDLSEITKNVQLVTSEMRVFLNDSVYPRGDNLERILLNLEKTSAELAKASSGSGERIEQILARIDTVTADIGSFVKTQTADPSEAEPGTLAGFIRRLDENMEVAEQSLQDIQSVTEGVREGRGTVGRLFTDDKLIDDVERIVSDVEGLTSVFTRTQIHMKLRTDYLFDANAFKSTVGVRLQPSPDKYYLLELIDDPLGKTTTRLRLTDNNDPRLPATLVEEISETNHAFKISAQLAKRFYFLTVRYGILESTGGIGLNFDFFDDKLGIQLDAFDFSTHRYPRLRAMLNWEFFDHMFVTGGIDNAMNDAARDWFVGFGVRFTDNDLKTLLSIVPTP